MKENEHIDVDLEFLTDEKNVQKKIISEKVLSDSSNLDEGSASKEKKSGINWTMVALIGGVAIFFILIFSSGDDSSTDINLNKGEGDTHILGDYRCSTSHYNKATELEPDYNEGQMASSENIIKGKEQKIERLENNIETSYVNEYSSQTAINQYNANIDEYNTALAAYKKELAQFNAKINTYNKQANVYNNYLEDNCTK